jgi:hypothetical protein
VGGRRARVSGGGAGCGEGGPSRGGVGRGGWRGWARSVVSTSGVGRAVGFMFCVAPARPGLWGRWRCAGGRVLCGAGDGGMFAEGLGGVGEMGGRGC